MDFLIHVAGKQSQPVWPEPRSHRTSSTLRWRLFWDQLSSRQVFFPCAANGTESLLWWTQMKGSRCECGRACVCITSSRWQTLFTPSSIKEPRRTSHGAVTTINIMHNARQHWKLNWVSQRSSDGERLISCRLLCTAAGLHRQITRILWIRR